ncbi:N(G),N(G)-dimethylarginine dimethylaminohydrolase 1-like isoform X2 [Ylistrum balloti]|uniref:N(G),N(G)-dimethylarginine dimethylaminohydrolase 1-like isoform X2 n=1 Tax=Ylistrum balloti TaxID=509963 RepID=UPI002905EA8C|nr:N(G),N(G)-dimethylarginine dimethylaminohydrolase 1-like isoform X2 [Ylistrum balloti]
MAAFQYNYAIVCRIPDSFQDIQSQQADADPIDIEKAREEHSEFIKTMKKCDVRVIELASDEAYPECPFLEDCALAIGGVALILRPFSKTRHGEVAGIRKLLQELNLHVYEIKDPDAYVNGGDVFFTGKEIFVGVGSDERSNERGANAIASVFPEYNVTPIKMRGDVRLKSLVCMAGRDIIACGNSPMALNVLNQIRTTAQYSYKILKLDNDRAANMLYVNGRLIHRTRSEIGEKCYSVLDEKITYVKHRQDITEMSKARGTLSSMVLFISKHRLHKEMISNIGPQDLTAYTEVSNF